MSRKKKIGPSEIAQAEVALIARFLGAAAEDFAGHSGNDFTLPATEKNKAVVLAVLDHRRRTSDEEMNLTAEEIAASTDEVFVYDYWAMAYFAERCDLIANGEARAAPLNQEELFAIGDLLALAYEDRERASDDVDSDNIALDLNAENQPIVKGTVELHRKEHVDYPEDYRNQTAAKLKKLSAALKRGGRIEIPDFWVIYFLAHRCRSLSGSTEPLYPPALETDDPQWWDGPVPTEREQQIEVLRKEASNLVRERTKMTRTHVLLVNNQLQIAIATVSDADRDTLRNDQPLVAALRAMVSRLRAAGFDFDGFSLISHESSHRTGEIYMWKLGMQIG